MSPVEAHARRYLERYATTRAHLRRLLRKRGEPEEIERVLDQLVAEGAIDDARYAAGRAEALARRGNSRAAIRGKLAAKGVREVPATDELAACCEYVRKKRLGAFGSNERAKDLARVCRAGFPLDVARKVLAMTVEEVRGVLAG
ncbi:MAG: regulatory protein RecX [Myxococcota bacterium]